jgi:aldose 1-epimerase
VSLFTLEGKNGLRAEITDYGATLVSLTVPDGRGGAGNVVLGYDSLDGYVGGSAYLGATVGRVANRVGGAEFSLDGRTYELDRNHGKHQLHGGTTGFNRRVWSADPLKFHGGPALSLTLHSADNDQGYPGNLHVVVFYGLTDDGLRMGYRATTDRPTPVNLTNHAYFNLDGAGNGTILDHVAEFEASRYLVTDADLVPTGEISPVAGTPLDFSSPTRVGARIDDPFLKAPGGYDHYFILDGKPGTMRAGARISSPESGRTLTVATTRPGFQFYTGNSLDEPGHPRRSGLCVEAQGYVDAVNHPGFPSVILRPGEIYEQTTEYRFSTEAV